MGCCLDLDSRPLKSLLLRDWLELYPLLHLQRLNLAPSLGSHIRLLFQILELPQCLFQLQTQEPFSPIQVH